MGDSFLALLGPYWPPIGPYCRPRAVSDDVTSSLQVSLWEATYRPPDPPEWAILGAAAPQIPAGGLGAGRPPGSPIPGPLVGLWTGFGWFGVGFGPVFGRFWLVFGRFWAGFGRFWQPRGRELPREKVKTATAGPRPAPEARSGDRSIIVQPNVIPWGFNRV